MGNRAQEPEAKTQIETLFQSQGHYPTLSQLEENYIQFIYNKVNQHQGRAAQVLGVSRRTLYRKLRSCRTH